MTTYVSEVQHALSHMQAQAEMTREAWQDEVAGKYYGEYLEYYDRITALFLTGSGGTDTIAGKGLEELLLFIDEKQAEMSAI